MGEYKISLKKSVYKDLEKIPRKDLKRIIKRIQELSKNPYPRGHEKLVGSNRYRIRQGSYRIVYSVQELQVTIWIIKIGHRRDIYRKIT